MEGSIDRYLERYLEAVPYTRSRNVPGGECGIFGATALQIIVGVHAQSKLNEVSTVETSRSRHKVA